MIEALGGVISGLGLFFVGMWLLSETLRLMSTRRLRGIASNWVPNLAAAWGWGTLFGSITQSLSAMTFITVSMARANFISSQRAFAFILGGTTGTGILILVVSLDVRIAALYAVGLGGMLIASERAIRYRNAATALFGIALMIVGLGLIKEAAASLMGWRAFDDFLRLIGDSLWFSFLGAVVLAFVIQSATAVILFALGMAAIGVLTDSQVVMTIYGSFIGAALITFVLSWNLSGVSRQVAMFGVFYNFVLVGILVPLFQFELWSGIPLVKALVLTVPLEQPLVLLPIFSDIFGSILFIALLPRLGQLFSRLWPATPAENISQAVYIHDRSYVDAATALELIRLEQRRVLSAFSSYLAAVRRGSGIDPLRDSVRELISEIGEFFNEVRMRHPGHAIDEVNSILAQHRLIVWLEEQFAELCAELNQLPNDEAAGQLRDVLVEGIDAAAGVDCLADVAVDLRPGASRMVNQRPRHRRFGRGLRRVVALVGHAGELVAESQGEDDLRAAGEEGADAHGGILWAATPPLKRRNAQNACHLRGGTLMGGSVRRYPRTLRGPCRNTSTSPPLPNSTGPGPRRRSSSSPTG